MHLRSLGYRFVGDCQRADGATAELCDRNENDLSAFYASLLITIRQREGRRCN